MHAIVFYGTYYFGWAVENILHIIGNLLSLGGKDGLRLTIIKAGQKTQAAARGKKGHGQGKGHTLRGVLRSKLKRRLGIAYTEDDDGCRYSMLHN